MKVKINLAGTGLVPPGDHLVEVRRVTMREKNDGTNKYLLFELEVVSGPHAGQRVDAIGSLAPEQFTAAKLCESLRAFGVEGDDVEMDYADDVEVSAQHGPDLLDPDLTGRRAIASVIHKQFGAQTYARVVRLRRP